MVAFCGGLVGEKGDSAARWGDGVVSDRGRMGGMEEGGMSGPFGAEKSVTLMQARDMKFHDCEAEIPHEELLLKM